MRFLPFLIILLAFAWWAQGVRARLRARSQAAAARKKRQQTERMRECAHCRVNVPESEALRRGDQYYCSDAHLRAGPRTH